MLASQVETQFERWMSRDDGSLRKARLTFVFAVIYVLFMGTYIGINLCSVGRPAHTLYLPGEERIPFIPLFEYLYVLTFFVPALLVVTLRDYQRFRRLLYALMPALVVAYSTYLLFPVYMERPQLEISSLHTWLLSLQYLDKPYNHFPSMHVTLSWLAVHSAQGSRATKVGVAAVAIGISVSTLFVKQHYVADVLFGFALAWSAWKVAPLIAASKSEMSAVSSAQTSAAE